uniref:Protein kinase domain-containing protein n=1 Tax=Ananas comosus var. bracteatus TaxID=296719 RepID=A0A6V7QJ50_ANACO|nr:unnamed protein product [Ananas comosus var. bracteatus]
MYYNRLSGKFRERRVAPAALRPPALQQSGQQRALREAPGGPLLTGALTSVVVFNNNLSGGVPDSLANCYTLDNIQLHGNKFSGEFPNTIWKAENLTTVMIRDNAFSGTIPDPLPWNLTRLEIQNNRFYGTILHRLAGCSWNFAAQCAVSRRQPDFRLDPVRDIGIDGPHPAQSQQQPAHRRDPGLIRIAPVLTSLDLSDNELSGPVPPQLGNLKLNFLNVSCNELSGPIPVSLQNQAYDRSFLSNPGLCSSLNIITNLRACGNRSGGLTKLGRSLFIVIVLLGGLLILGTAVVGALMVREYLKREKEGPDLAAWKLTSFHHLDFTEESIIRGLTEDRLIGSGGSGKVYRIELGPENTVAVKKIWNSRKFGAKLEKQFQAEVQILSSIRHNNIVKLFCCISSSDSKLLVYEYMENKSLDMWLHGPAGASVPLDWPMRLDIAIGAAQGCATCTTIAPRRSCTETSSPVTYFSTRSSKLRSPTSG